MSLAEMALGAHGREAQLGQATEELAELIVAIRHMQRGRITPIVLADEIADVELMLEQLALIVRQYTGTDATMDQARTRKRAKALVGVQARRLARG